jgi:hypothetical protein
MRKSAGNSFAGTRHSALLRLAYKLASGKLLNPAYQLKPIQYIKNRRCAILKNLNMLADSSGLTYISDNFTNFFRDNVP